MLQMMLSELVLNKDSLPESTSATSVQPRHSGSGRRTCHVRHEVI
jgi:hypothetical protein